MGGFYKGAFKFSLIGHGAAVVLAVIIALCVGWVRHKPIEIPLTFTVVMEEPQEAALQEPAAPTPVQRLPPKAPPDPPKPPPPPPPPPPADAVVPVVKPEPEKPKPEPVKPTPEPEKPKPKPKPAPEPEKKPIEKPAPKSTTSGFKKGERVVRRTTVNAPPVTLTRQSMLSASEIARLLAAGAKAGEENVIPQNEVQQCFLLVKQALYGAWTRPSQNDAGRQPAQIELTFGPGGVIRNVRLVRPSGSALHDQSAVAAGRSLGRINGLTARFLRAYTTVTVDFELE